MPEKLKNLFGVSLVSGLVSALLTAIAWAAILITTYYQNPAVIIDNGLGGSVKSGLANFLLFGYVWAPLKFLGIVLSIPKNGLTGSIVILLSATPLMIALFGFALFGGSLAYNLLHPSEREFETIKKLGIWTGLVEAFVLFAIEFCLSWKALFVTCSSTGAGCGLEGVIFFYMMFFAWEIYMTLFAILPWLARVGVLRTHKYLRNT